jgi:hypothetical protein
MLPSSIAFTGSEHQPLSILESKRVTKGWPSSWTRHQTTTKSFIDDRSSVFDRWMDENMTNRWGSYSVFMGESGEIITVFAFESVSDAVMFRMLDGENAWRNTGEMNFV